MVSPGISAADPASGWDAETGFALSEVRGVLVATLPGQLSEPILQSLCEALLDAVEKRHWRGVVIDLSAVPLMDSVEFEQLRHLAQATAWLGSRCLFVGLSAGLVSLLVDLDAPLAGVSAHAGLDDAFAVLGT